MEDILSLLKKDYVYLELKKKDAAALQDGLASYIKAVHHYCLPFPPIPYQYLTKS